MILTKTVTPECGTVETSIILIADKTLRIWDRTGRRPTLRFESHGDAVKSVRFDRYASTTDFLIPAPVLSASNDKSVRYWRHTEDTKQVSEVFILRGHTEKVAGVDFRSSSHAVSGGWDKTIFCWDLTTGKVARKIPNAGIVSSISAHADTVIATTRDKIVRVWDLRAKTGDSKAVISLKGHTAPTICHHADSLWIGTGLDNLYNFHLLNLPCCSVGR